MIAALFVQKQGCYFNLPNVDPWDEDRDATLYPGPYPVVAHPPCQRWGVLAEVNYIRWGGEHNAPGNDQGRFLSALSSVRTWGGVLEHPANTRAFGKYGISLPNSKGGWTKSKDGGWVCCVWQSAYGHRANKATWLYYFGNQPPYDLRWNRPRGTHQVGGAVTKRGSLNKPTLSRKEASATPTEFRDELINLAIWSKEHVRSESGVFAEFWVEPSPEASRG